MQYIVNLFSSLSLLLDNYVHRLVQNKADGKLVEVAGSPGQMGNSEKVDSLQLEVYTL